MLVLPSLRGTRVQMTKDQEELKPCPFCGQVPPMDGAGQWQVVKCQTLDCPMRYFSCRPDAWNRRVLSNTVEALKSALRAAETAMIIHEPERTDAVLDLIRRELSK